MESEHIGNTARFASSREQGHAERHGPGPATDLGATLSVGRLQEHWEKADSERQISEEEKSRGLAQGRWKKKSKKRREIFLHSRPAVNPYNQAHLATHQQQQEKKILDAACTLKSVQKLVFCWQNTGHVLEFIKE